ncbi:hypothetical protein JHW43_003905 [Diplocarpon mali]|nr:hypothetical protein JHW43_003905 [Diplocarpon mali]
MAEGKIKLPAGDDETPSYDAAAAQHGALPTRSGPPPGGKPTPRGPFPLDIPRKGTERRLSNVQQIGLTNLEILPSTKPEDLSKSQPPFEYVLATAVQKCLDVYSLAIDNSLASIPDPSLVIAADTVIVTGSGRILEKPRNEKDHIFMLKLLRDQRVHKVFTAVAVLAPREDARDPGYNLETTVEETKVVFAKEVSDQLIEAYVRTREGVDKAGGYGIQGIGSLLVERIEGSWDNVVGLPLRATLALIEKVVMEDQEESEEEEE